MTPLRAYLSGAGRGLVLVAALVFGAVGRPAAAAGADPIAIVATPVPLAHEHPERTELGRLDYRGGLRLTSPDRRFGGLSDLHVTTDGRTLIAVTDRGNWLRATLSYDESGRLSGVADAEMGALRGPDGEPMRGLAGDAEALAFLPDGSALVGFERRHRLLLYPPSDPPFAKRPQPYTRPVGLERAPANGGLEALTHVGSRYLFALTEKLRSSGASVAGWVGRDGQWGPFTYLRPPGFAPTGATLLPGGDVLVIERKYTPLEGPTVRMMVLDRATIAPRSRLEGREIAKLAQPLTVDNFEGVAARRGPRRETLIYLLSDDNFSPLQRTLLMMFALRDREAPE